MSEAALPPPLRPPALAAFPTPFRLQSAVVLSLMSPRFLSLPLPLSLFSTGWVDSSTQRECDDQADRSSFVNASS